MQKNKENLLTHSVVVCLLAFVCCFLWGSAFPCVKIGYRISDISSDDTVSQILYAGMRFTLAGIMVIVYSSIANKKFISPKGKNESLQVMKLSFFQTIMQYFFFYIGLANTSGVKSSIIIGSNVFVSIVVSSLIFRLEKITLNKALGCIIGFAGILVINLSGGNLGEGLKLTGEGFIFISTFSYAFSSVLMKKYSKTTNPVMLSGWQFLFGGIVMTAFGLASGGEVQINSPSSVAMIGYLAFISAAAYTLWATLLKHNPVSKVSVYGFMNPVIGVILSSVFLKEDKQPSLVTAIIALALVCGGIYVVNREKK